MDSYGKEAPMNGNGVMVRPPSFLAAAGALFGAFAVVMAPAGSVFAQDIGGDGNPVTFARDVAPILQENCQVCHRPGQMGPMSLLTYEEVRPWAPLIRERVSARAMPPWQIDPHFGIQAFKNDGSLRDEEIATIVRWVDGGTPLGDPMDLPSPREWPDDDRWALEDEFGRPPDLVLTSPSYLVPAQGLDQWFAPTTTIDGLSEPRWARAAEIRPGDLASRYVFHHANASGLISSGAGKDYDLYPKDAGRLIEPGQRVSWNLHLYPIGEEVDAFIEIGLWFHEPGDEPQFSFNEESFRADLYQDTWGRRPGHPCWEQPAPDLAECDEPDYPRGTELALPPHGVAMLQGTHVLDRPLRITSIRGHMHQRGKYHVIEAIYTDGRREVLNRINWDHKWHLAHVYEDHAAPLLPKGTVLLVTSQFDNTVNNPSNPDPDQWVFFGRRAPDEMSHVWMGVTWFDDEAAFERLVAEREAELRAREIADAAGVRE